MGIGKVDRIFKITASSKTSQEVRQQMWGICYQKKKKHVKTRLESVKINLNEKKIGRILYFKVFSNLRGSFEIILIEIIMMLE